MRTRFYVEVCEDCGYGHAGYIRFYAPEGGKTLKKLWKHICNVYADNWLVSYITAYVENEDGTVQHIGQYWALQEMAHLADKGIIPFA